MATPERAVWPLPPRPPVLPLPEPMPRPTRMRVLFAPGLSRSSFKRAICLSPYLLRFVPSAPNAPPVQSLLFAADDAHEVRDLVDHAAHFGSVFEGPLLADLVEAEPDQGRPLIRRTTGRGRDLLDGYGCLVSHLCLHRLLAATGLEIRNLEAAARRDRTRAVDLLERVERGAHHVVGVRRALRLGDDVVDAKGLEHGAHRTAGDDAGAGHCRAENDLA